MNWQKRFDNSVPFKNIKAIPQSHNTGSYLPLYCNQWPLWLFAQCQNKTIREQLDMGIRALDLRVTKHNGDIYLSHHFLSNCTLNSALNDVTQFLQEHPSEFVFIFIKEDWKTCSWENEDYEKMWYFFDVNYMLPQNTNVSKSTVGQLRGKMIPVIFGEFLKTIPKKMGYMNIDTLDIIQCWNTKSLQNAKEKIENNILKPTHLYRGIGLTVVIKLGKIPLPPLFVHYGINNWFFKQITSVWNKATVGFVGYDYVNHENTNELIQLNF